MKKALEWIRKWSPLVLAFSFIAHGFILFHLYQDYTSYRIEYETSKSRMFSLYREGEDVEYIQSQVAHLKATAGMRLADITKYFWDTMYVMVPISIMYMFIYMLSIVIKDAPRQDLVSAKPDKVIPYMSKDVGEPMFDDRDKKEETGVH